jgi:hypothetical protein
MRAVLAAALPFALCVLPFDLFFVFLRLCLLRFAF